MPAYDGLGAARVNLESQRSTFGGMWTATLGGSGSVVDVFGLMFTGSGASLKPSRLTRAQFSLITYSGGNAPPPVIVTLARRTTLTNSGMSGTFTALPIVQFDSRDAAPTLLPVIYTNYSGFLLGTLDGAFFRSKLLAISNASGTQAVAEADWRFPEGGEKQPVLRNSGTQFSIELQTTGGGGFVLSGMLIAGGFTWTEELSGYAG